MRKRPKKKTAAPSGAYRPAEMLVYEYFDGKRTVKADPMALYKRFMTKVGDMEVKRRIAFSESRNAAENHTALIEDIRAIFNLPPLRDGIEVDGTLSDPAALDLLDRFLEWLEELKKNSPPIPTCAGTTSGSTASTPGAGPATSNISDSGSTASGTPTGSPSPPPRDTGSPPAPPIQASSSGAT